MNTREREVPGLGRITVLTGDDMIDLVAKPRGRLGETTIFTAVLRRPPNRPSGVVRHEDEGRACWSDKRALDW